MKQLIIFALVCLPLLCACGGSQQKEADATYKTLTVTQSDQILKSDYTATLRGRQYVEIRPQVSGIITRICINEGDPVHKGQTLFIIDQVPYKAALETAVANVKSAEAKLATAKLTADSKAELYKEQIVSEFDLQTARNEQAAAEAALAQAKAQEVNARNDLSYTEVKSPVNGVASMIPYRVGALVNSSITEPLVTVSDDSEVYAYFSMTENDIRGLIRQYGTPDEVIKSLPAITLRLNDGTEYEQKGRIETISGIINPQTGTVSIRCVFPNEKRLLFSGGIGNVVLPHQETDAIVIPQSATYEIQDKIFVYKVIDGKAVASEIVVAKQNDGKHYIVRDGLTVGDKIISEGVGLVQDGAEVSIKE